MKRGMTVRTNMRLKSGCRMLRMGIEMRRKRQSRIPRKWLGIEGDNSKVEMEGANLSLRFSREEKEHGAEES